MVAKNKNSRRKHRRERNQRQVYSLTPSINSFMLQTCPVSPAAVAGVLPIVEWTAKVVVPEEQSDHRFVVFPKLAECVCQPREAPDTRANRQIRALNVRRAGGVKIRVAGNRWHMNASYHAGAVLVVIRCRPRPPHCPHAPLKRRNRCRASSQNSRAMAM